MKAASAFSSAVEPSNAISPDVAKSIGCPDRTGRSI